MARNLFETIASNFARSHKGLTGTKKARQYAEHIVGTDITPEKVDKIIAALKKKPEFKKLSKDDKEKAIRIAIGKSMVIKQATTGTAIKAGLAYGGYKAVSSLASDKED